jgi:hypothetical protein
MNTVPRIFWLNLFVGVLLLPSSFGLAQKADSADSINKTGCFTNIFYHEEAGDVLGTELFIVYSNDGYYVLFQDAEGEPSPPQLVRATVTGDRISFQLPATQGFRTQTVTGNFTPTALTCKFAGTIIKLIRGKSYWQR